MDDTDYINVTVQFCFPNINSSCRKEVRTGAVNTFLFIFLSCVSVCTVFLNLLVIISISHFKQLHTPTNLLLLSLAVADLLVGLVVMPVNVIGFLDSCWYLGKMGCTVHPLISFVSLSASLCSLIFIAVDRYIAISDPLLYSTRVTVCKTSLLIVLGWSLCLFYVCLGLYFNDHLLQSQISTRCYGECLIGLKKSWVVIDLVVSFMTPCSVILVLYSVIVSAARRQAKAFRAVVNPASQNPGGRGSGSSETKAAKKLGTVVLVYLACYVPFYICSLSAEAVTSVSVVWIIFGWLQLSNSALNPLLYKGACPTMTGLTDQMDDTDYINLTVQFCFPNINSSCRKEVRTGAVNTFLFIFLSCVSVCTVFLNLLVIISISHFKQLHTPTNLLLLSLAVADLLVGLVVMPVTVIGFLDSCWYLGKMGCTLYPLTSFVSLSASLCSLIFIAVDRYIAISDPLLYSTRVTVCKTSLLIVLGWSLCLFYAILILYFNDHLLQSQISTRCYGECVVSLKKSWVVIDLVVSFMTPCSVILVLYSVIVSAARRQAKAFRAVVNPASQNPGGRQLVRGLQQESLSIKPDQRQPLAQ
ncbi:hypothetical protein NFI96_006807 [Prochilodus magdalenae]|nr:hypothetical protein NFI96_006807 [Prochilodus magdalenae]